MKEKLMFKLNKNRSWFKYSLVIISCLTAYIWTGYAMPFKTQQLKFPRVRQAYQNQEQNLRQKFKAEGLEWPPQKIFFRAFKMDAVFEVWVKNKNSQKYVLFEQYEICSLSGKIGPKRQQGDFQIPEGVYHISGFNPASLYHLSLRVNYPNQSDRVLGVKKNLGGDIFVHGDCVTVGCIPLTDDIIEKIYVLSLEAKNEGNAIPIHIFPTRLSSKNLLFLEGNHRAGVTNVFRSLYEYFKKNEAVQSNEDSTILWKSLKPVYDYFEKNKTLPNVKINNNGQYYIKN